MNGKDMLEKALEAYNDVFADIINVLVFDGEQIVQEKDLQDAQPFSLYYDGEKDREQFRDIVKLWEDPEEGLQGVRLIMFGIENQTSYDKDMPIRVMSYDAAQYRKQLDGKERYPVVTLIIYYGESAWGNTSLLECIDVPEIVRPYVSDYRINVFDISKMTDEEIGRFQSDFRIIADYLKHSKDDPGYIPKESIDYKHAWETLDLISHFTGNEKYREIYRERKEEVKDMISAADFLVEKGRKEGLEKGMEKGRQEGLEKGMEKGRQEGLEKGMEEGIEKGSENTLLQNIQALVKNLSITKEEAMNLLQVPEEKRAYFLTKI